MPLVDFVARIDNDGASPHLRAYIRVNPDGNWNHIKSRFAKPETSGCFPGALSPLRLWSVPDPSSLMLQHSATGSSGGSTLELDVRSAALGLIRDAMCETMVSHSPECEVTLQGRARTLAGIPAEATSFAFAYPVQMDWSKVPDVTQHNCECLVAMAGSFVYFDHAGAVCGVNAVTIFMDDEDPEEESLSVWQSSVPSRPLVQFCPPLPLPEATYQALRSNDRLRPVTMASLLDKGAYAFAWILPGEHLEGLTQVPHAGAFAYVFHPSKLQAALDTSLWEPEEARALEDDAAASGTSTACGFDGYFPAKHEGCYFPVAF
jgi:hypothetical protein